MSGKPESEWAGGTGHAPVHRDEATLLKSNDDTSLQAWGRKLGALGPAIAAMATRHEAAAAASGQAAEAVAKIAQIGESDLPTSNALSAEVSSLAAELRKANADAAAAAQRIRALASRADALPATYRREHETDEDRLDTPRKSRQAEKRADVAAAEQDT